MTVYVDKLVPYPRGTVKGAERVTAWCHMFSDTETELHEMALKIGMKRSWFQAFPGHSLPHYDLSTSRRRLALQNGAQEFSQPFTLEDFQRFRWGLQRTPTV